MKNHFVPANLVIALALLLSGCATATSIPTRGPDLTDTAKAVVPTSTPSPAPTQTPSPTMTPTPVPTLIGGYPEQYAMAVDADNEWRINIYDASGSLVKAIFKYKYDPDDKYIDYMDMKVSPAGDRICFNYQVDGVGKLVVIGLDGKEIFEQDVKLGFYGGWVGQVNWSPDGQWLVFASRGAKSYIDIYMVDKNGQNLQQLTNDRADNSSPSFLPQGKKIQYYQEYAIKVMTLEDKSVVQLGSQYPRSWTRDERYYIVGGNSFDVKLVDTETRKTTAIFHVQHPGSSVYTFNMMFSPDDQWILVQEYDGDHTRKSAIPYGTAWYKINLSSPKEPELLAYAGDVKFTPDGSMLIVHGFLASESASGKPKYYAIDLRDWKVTVLSELAQVLLNGTWLSGSTAAEITDTQAFIGPTPVPTWALMPEPPIYDSFDGEELQTSLWKVPNPQSTQDYTWAISQGEMNVQTKKRLENSELDLRKPEPMSSSDFYAFEAKMKLWSGTVGSSYASMELSAAGWWTQCALRHEKAGSFFACDVFFYKTNRWEMEYRTYEIPIQLNTWYVARLELSPTSGALQFYLDGRLINTYCPDNAAELMAGVKLNSSIGVHVTDGSINASFDDVKIGQK